MKYLNSILSKNLIIIFLCSFITLFLGNYILFYSKYIAIGFYTLSILLLLLPLSIITLHKQIKIEYPKELRWLISTLLVLGVFFYTAYFLHSDFALGKWMYTVQDEATKIKYQTIHRVLEIVYLILLFIIFITSIIIQNSLKVLQTNTSKIYYLKNIIINVSLFFIFLIGINYISTLRPLTVDLTLVGKYSLSNEGKRIIKSLASDKKVTITAFYPYFHQLQRDVEIALNNIHSINPNIEFKIVDALKEHDIAVAKKVDRNGIIVFESIDITEFNIQKREHIDKIEIQSEADLKTMEQQIISSILSVTQPVKNVYFTTGHGEVSNTDSEQKMNLWFEELGKLNYQINYLDIKTGFPPAIPNNANIICILGAQKTFSPEEQKAIILWLKNGGRLLLTIDPEKKADFTFLLQPFYIQYNPKTVYSENSVKNKKELLIASNYTEHPVIQSFVHLEARENFTILPSAGSFDTIKEDATKVLNPLSEFQFPQTNKVFFVKSSYNSWNDVILNGQNDSKQEPFQYFNLAFATNGVDTVTNKAFRFVAYGDTHFLLDPYIVFPGKNYELAVNSIKWLASDEKIDGIVPKSEETKRIVLSSFLDDIIFYAIVLLYPLLILLLGSVYIKKRKA